MNLYKSISSGLLFLCLLACSNAETGTQALSESPPEPILQLNSQEQSVQKVFIISSNGGCIRMGPNCPRYMLMGDGSFTVYRGDATEISASGKIESSLVESWVTLVNKTNFAELRSRLDKGECKACYDGVDITYTIFKGEKSIVLNSQENDFSQKEVFFTLSDEIHRAMQDAAPLEVKSHR